MNLKKMKKKEISEKNAEKQRGTENETHKEKILL